MSTKHSQHQQPVRDVPPTGGDSYARECFTWRRMRPWHIWTLVILAVAFVVAGRVHLQ